MTQTDAPEPPVDLTEANVIQTVAPEVVSEAVSAPRPPKRGGMIGSVLGGVFAAAIGFVLAQYVPNGWPFAATNDLSVQVSAQMGQIETLQDQLAKLPKSATTDPALLDRIAALEGKSPPGFGPIEDRLLALETRLTAIEALPADGSGAASAAIAALQANVQALRSAGSGQVGQDIAAATEARLKVAEKAAAAVTAVVEKLAKTARQQEALGKLRLAFDSGAAYGASLAELAAEIDPVPAILSANAETGLPTLSALRSSFPPAARLALDAALRADMGQSWSERAASFLRSQTGARSLEPREGTDPDAILSRAEAAVDRGDLAATLSEMTALPPEAQPALADWRAMAETRLAAEQAIAALAATLGE